MTNEYNPPGRSRRLLRRGANASGPVQKNGAQDTDMNERMEAAFLVVQALNGDGLAFEKLYEQSARTVQNRIKAVVFPRLRDRHLNDLIQESWKLIWQHLEEYDPARGNFRSFARFWAGKVLLRWLARRKRVSAFFDLLMEQLRRYPEMESAEMDPLENLIHVDPFADWWDRQALAAKADKAIGQLLRTKSDPLEILSLMFAMFREWPPREMAAKLSGRTLWAITNLVARLVRQRTDVHAKRVNAHFSMLRTQLRGKVEDCFRGSRHIRLLRRCRGTRVGDLLLNDCYTGRVKGGPPAEIVKWRASAVTRLRQLARRPGNWGGWQLGV